MTPKLSYGAKTLLLDIINSGTNRRDFLKQSLIIAAGVAFFSVSIAGKSESAPPSNIFCGCYGDCHSQCYSNCHCACHGRCGRKSW